MSVIEIHREHHLPRERVKTRIDGLVERLQETFEGDYTWQDDTLSFKRPGASGRIVIEEKQVNVQIRLGMLLRPFRATVEEAVRDYLNEHLV